MNSFGVLALLGVVVFVAAATSKPLTRSALARWFRRVAMITGLVLTAVFWNLSGMEAAWTITSVAIGAVIWIIQGSFEESEESQTAEREGSKRERKSGSGDLHMGKDSTPNTTAHTCPECGTVLADDAPEGLCPKCLLHSGLGSAFPSPPVSDDRTGAYHGPFLAPAPAELAHLFPHLEILGLIGQGGMGAVYKARQVKLDRVVALKILPPEWGKDPAFAERFTREARALAKLSHPHIVAIHDFGEADGLYYFVMEYVDGANLRQALQNGQLPPEEALRIAPQLCEALQYAHEEGFVHRDIKPENILLDRRGRVKVADFGLAKLVGPTPGHFTLTGSRQVVGTPHYMAPEQMERPQTIDHRADIYSLGVVLYEMLTGELPLGRFAPPSRKADIDARLDDVVLRALAKEPEDRYQRVSDVRTDLAGIAAGTLPEGVAGVARPAAVAERLAVPFTLATSKRRLSDKYTITSYSGILTFAGGDLRLEVESRQREYGPGGILEQTTHHEKVLPLSDLESIRLQRGWVRTAILIQMSRMSLVADVPGSSQGQVKLHVTRRDREVARELVARVTRKLPRRSSAGGGSEFPGGTGTPSDEERERVRSLVAGPATGLLLTGWLTFVFGIAGGLLIIGDWRGNVGGGHRVWIYLSLLGLVALLGVTALLVVGGMRMLRQRSYSLAVTASVWAVLPWPFGFLITVPFEHHNLSPASFVAALAMPPIVWILGSSVGVWALGVLLRPEVRAVFGEQPTPGRGPMPAPPSGFFRRKVQSLARAARYWVVDSFTAGRASAEDANNREAAKQPPV